MLTWTLCTVYHPEHSMASINELSVDDDWRVAWRREHMHAINNQSFDFVP